ncbi:MAG: manganese/zinc/iron transport system permease protein [Rhodobacteraceae bacterium HLUCCO18]|nr:MAG: manganese/zinc/iron transport system permease protein [Rhodobacteraceae bacterium HLUCCO18]
MTPLLDALFLQAGHNAALVAIGAGLLGYASGATGTFLFLRKRALLSDAAAHATLPGVALAFIVMVALGGDGRNLAGLLLGSAITAAIGLVTVQWIVAHTRLTEDAAIGAVLGVFFGVGVVLLTVIQTMSSGRQAGLEDFLLGSTAGMLRQDALVIAAGGALALALTWALRRPMTLVSFDADFATAAGYRVSRIDLMMMLAALVVTVIGLKVVGLVLIVALLIIPPVAARFWTESVGRMIWIAGAIGGISGYAGAAVSASAPNLPTGPIIVLMAAGVFVASLLFAPVRGVAAAFIRQRRFKARVHHRQGLLAIARQEPIRETFTLRLLQRENLIRADGVPTEAGRAAAAKVSRDERRWDIARRIHQDAGLTGRYDGLTPIEDVFTADEIQEFDRRIGPPVAVEG